MRNYFRHNLRFLLAFVQEILGTVNVSRNVEQICKFDRVRSAL